MRLTTTTDAAVKDATGKSWKAWFALLKKSKAAALSHKDIAKLLTAEHGVPGWWAQSITVEFERHIGRRTLGQSSAGDYRTSVTKTLSGSLDSALKVWQQRVAKLTTFDGVAFKDKPSVRKTKKWRYWRVALVDGGRVVATIGMIGADKVQLAIGHEKLKDKKSLDRWKAHWKAFLAKGL